MEEKTDEVRSLNWLVAAGILLAVAGLTWWIWLISTGGEPATSLASVDRVTAPDAAPQRETVPVATRAAVTVPSGDRRRVVLSEPVLFTDDLGTGSTEFSAVTLNEDTNRLMIADDEGQLFEFDVDDASLPIVPARRALVAQFDDRDIEGISWVSGNTYVLAHEVTGRLSVVEIGETQTTVGESDVKRIIDTQVRGIDGNGIEGVADVETIDDTEFIVVEEQPPRLIFVDDDGAPTSSISLRLGVEDVSDVFASSDGTVWVVSDLGRVVVRLTIEADGTVRQLQQLDLVLAQGRFEQPEGLALSRDGTRLYVVGESPGVGQFTLGFWSLS